MTAHIHIRTTMERKSAYVRAAKPKPLAEWLIGIADRALRTVAPPDISGINLPEPCFGLGVPALVDRWIDREIALREAGMNAAALQTKMMRRELQEAADLVVDPSKV